jgi:hypothetical protein
MIKLAITIWLSLVSMLGPTLCCHAFRAVPIESNPDSCCSHQPQSPALPSEPGCHDRPCGEVDALPPTGTSTAQDTELLLAPEFIQLPALLPEQNLATLDRQVWSGPCSFLTPRELLRLLHVLRC